MTGLVLVLCTLCHFTPVALGQLDWGSREFDPRQQRASSVESPHAAGSKGLVAGGHIASPAGWGLNAKDFGAIGDGVADDAKALSDAIDAATRQGKTLLLPAGTYVLWRP